MAGIDKTYVTWEQYRQVKDFFTKEMKEKQKKDIGYYFGYADWRKSDFGDGNTLPVWNTPSIVDLWLAQNCKLDFVQERLHQQYSKDWLGWRNDVSFEEEGFIYTVLTEDNKVWLSINRENTDINKELIIYGTTYFYEIWRQVLGIMRGESYKVFNKSLQVDFYLFGLWLTYREGKYYILEDNAEIETFIGYYPIPSILLKGEKDEFLKFLPKVNLKHSWKKSEIKKYEPHQIILSSENSAVSIDAYVGFTKESSERYLRQLPDFIFDYLK
jgi:hypothetical protein